MNRRSPLLAGAMVVAITTVVLLLTRVPVPDAARELPNVAEPPAALTCSQMEHAGTITSLATTVVLLDASLTFNSREQTSPFANATSKLTDVLSGLLKMHAKPHRIVVGTMGALDVPRVPVCDMTAPRGSLFTRTCSEAQVRASIHACSARAASHEGERTTDISGAVVYAATLLQSRASLTNTLLVFSDFEEDLGRRHAPRTDLRLPDLSSTCVVLYYDFKGGEGTAVSASNARARVWGERLRKEASAKGVLVQASNSLSLAELTQFLDDCEHSEPPAAAAPETDRKTFREVHSTTDAQHER
jgi:hypothetical protein